MKRFFFTPGPSQLYFTVESHLKQALKLDIPSISHRSDAFKDIYKQTTNGLRELLGLSDDQHILFTSSATEVWERIALNLIERESFHLVNGSFSKKFKNTVEQLGKSGLESNTEDGKVVDINKLLVPESAELIAITQNETSTGAAQPLDDIYSLRKAFPNQLIAVDMVSAAPSVALDYSQVDTAYFSVQKCFGLPAGLGVWIVNQRCVDKCEQLLNNGLNIGSYHSLPVLLEQALNYQTPETPNVLNIYLLGKVVEDMLNKGIDQIRREIDYKAAVLYQAFEQAAYLRPFVETNKHRSKTTPVAASDMPSSTIIDHFAKMGIVLGAGYGRYKEAHLRIANFPTHSKEHIEMIADRLCELK